MSTEKGRKLNRLQRLLPEGLLVDAAWLEGKGYSSDLQIRYRKSGWLEQPARGVYRRPSAKLLWPHVVISLQALLHVPVIVGGRTALELHGFSHYVSPGGVGEVHLYGEDPLPGWVGKLNLDVQIVFHNAKKLFREEFAGCGLGNTKWSQENQTFANTVQIREDLTNMAWGQWGWPLTSSKPERAVLELLDEVPERETFHQVDKLIEGLRTLSPRRMQKLLEDCRNVKVKRLFFWFAERHGFRWLHQIQRERIDLGKGKRMLVRGGKLDRKYLITVPKDLDGSQ